MNIDEIIEFYGQLDYEKDIRWFPDDNRRSMASFTCIIWFIADLWEKAYRW
jgi:hypothetical protein